MHRLFGLSVILLHFTCLPALAQTCNENDLLPDEAGRIRIVHGPLQNLKVGNHEGFFVEGLGWREQKGNRFQKKLNEEHPSYDVWILSGEDDPRQDDELAITGMVLAHLGFDQTQWKLDRAFELFPSHTLLLSLNPCVSSFFERRRGKLITITFLPEFVESK